MSLLLAGLAEIHSNAEMFGGLDSVSFKIKWKQINKRGKAICKLLQDKAASELFRNDKILTTKKTEL